MQAYLTLNKILKKVVHALGENVAISVDCLLMHYFTINFLFVSFTAVYLMRQNHDYTRVLRVKHKQQCLQLLSENKTHKAGSRITSILL